MNQNYNWMLGGNGDWLSPSNWTNLYSPNNFSNTPQTAGSENTAVFATGSSKLYTVTSSNLAKVGNLIVSHDNVNFSHFYLEYNNLGNPYTGLDIGITVAAHVTVGSDSAWNGNTWGNEHSYLDVDSRSSLTVNGFVSGFVTRVTNDSNVTLSGRSAVLNYAPVRGAPSANESTIDKSSFLSINNGAHASGAWLDDKGTIAINGVGSTLTNNANGTTYSTVEAGANINGSNGATLAGSVINAGVIDATMGTFHVTASVTNSTVVGVSAGHFQIESLAVLELGSNTNQGMTFLKNAELDLDKGVDYRGVISAFGTGDKIDLLGQAVTAVYTTPTHAGTTNVLVVNSSSTVESLTFTGSYSHNNLFAQADGHGGTLIGFGTNPSSINIS